MLVPLPVVALAVDPEPVVLPLATVVVLATTVLAPELGKVVCGTSVSPVVLAWEFVFVEPPARPAVEE